MPDYALLMTELEVLLNTVGAAATRLKARLRLNLMTHAHADDTCPAEGNCASHGKRYPR